MPAQLSSLQRHKLADSFMTAIRITPTLNMADHYRNAGIPLRKGASHAIRDDYYDSKVESCRIVRQFTNKRVALKEVIRKLECKATQQAPVAAAPVAAAPVAAAPVAAATVKTAPTGYGFATGLLLGFALGYIAIRMETAKLGPAPLMLGY